MNQVELILQSAIILKDQVDNNLIHKSEVETGICGLLSMIAISKFQQDTSTRKLKEYFITWDKYSGNESYPVPYVGEIYRSKLTRANIDYIANVVDTGINSPEYCAKLAYVICDNVWIGEYGTLRRELLDHIIKSAKQGLELCD